MLPRDVDTADDSGWTPLIIACSAGHTDIVHMLVEKGAKVRHGMTKIIAHKDRPLFPGE